jgi:hypothetical protein
MLEIIVARGCTSLQAETAVADTGLVAIVRVYNYAQVPTPLLHDAMHGAAGTFSAAGLASQWRICAIRQSPTEPEDPMCEGITKANEFLLRINHGPEAGTELQHSPAALGYAVVLPERRGIVATVHSARISALADRTGVDEATLMGLVMAHEVGHLLLGTTEHTGRGLMRAKWKLNVWSISEHTAWRFSADEVARMQRGTVVATGN